MKRKGSSCIKKINVKTIPLKLKLHRSVNCLPSGKCIIPKCNGIFSR